MKRIGFIGVGVMGKSMVRNLMKKGFELSIYSRTQSKCEDVIHEGALWCETVEKCARSVDAVITMVGYPKDVEEVYFGKGGILGSVKPGTYVIDMTTTSPQLSARIYKSAREKGVFALDAPVSGGDIGAQKGTLSIMVGGDREAFDACIPLFDALGTNTIYEGGAGFGQHTKMANQIALSGIIAGVCEALAYARAVGLDAQTMLDSIGAGAAGSWQMNNMAPRILKGDFAPGFFIKHYIKDMTIASEEAECAGISLEILNDVCRMYQDLAQRGMGDPGTQALMHYYDCEHGGDKNG
ncbi:NAD(P)-dependent oxidoreductase [Marasmitruncus massiliensis]|uniref:NAD(P)-dependent oxidoreductase n=1 Tax=Marasmitruncus massiliensis TaxID=1944642 RepID=UPI000C7CEC99|nr:NAD(P)-dependent oxidoreductase [Marasmitruncus massiliensis]